MILLHFIIYFAAALPFLQDYLIVSSLELQVSWSMFAKWFLVFMITYGLAHISVYFWQFKIVKNKPKKSNQKTKKSDKSKSTVEPEVLSQEKKKSDSVYDVIKGS